MSTELQSALEPSAIATLGGQENDLKARVASILGIVESPAWRIIDQVPEDNLVLAHYDSEANLNQWGFLRGYIVDVKEGVVVCGSYGYSPTITVSHLDPTEDGTLTLRDDFGNAYVFPQGRYQLKRGFEGVILRVFKYRGKVYHASHRKINPVRSRW